MKSIVKTFILLLICMFMFARLAWNNVDSIMYWQLGSTGNTVDDGPNDVYTFLGFNHANDEIGVRIAAYDKDGNLVKYLNPIWKDENRVKHIETDFNDSYVGTRDDIWMTRASQAYYGPDGYLEMLFQMQVGNYDEDFNFSPLLWTRGELVDGKYWYDTGTLAPHNGDWIPTQFYTINPVVPITPSPEPNSGILFLIGIGFLGLRRKPVGV